MAAGWVCCRVRDPSLMRAIKSRPDGRVAVTYVEWAGAGIQSVIIPWRVIASSADARSFADELTGKPITRALMTSISEVLLMSSWLFSTSPIQGLRHVIAVSGDGPNNSGSAVEAARDREVCAGIMINGLAIRIRSGLGGYSYFDLPDLDRYYKDCVIGGGGSFVLSIRHKREFATAIRQKLLLEITNAVPQRTPQLRHVQLQKVTDKYDCLIGEKLWQQYQQDQW